MELIVMFIEDFIKEDSIQQALELLEIIGIIMI